MFDEYLGLLRGPLPDPGQKTHLARSLRYAGYRKVIPIAGDVGRGTSGRSRPAAVSN